MARALVIVRSDGDRRTVADWAYRCERGTRVEFKGPKRTIPQNDRMWAMLTDIAEQVEHCGRKYNKDVWKVLFLHGVGNEVELVPSLDGKSLVPWGRSSSDLSKDEMTQLIEFMFAWGAEHGVAFNDPKTSPTMEG